jgi:hypothetical protein
LPGWNSLVLRSGSLHRPLGPVTPLVLATRAASGVDPRLRQRLERVLLLPSARCNVTEATRLGGFDQATFSSQLQQLEAQLGGLILNRAVRNQPGELTDLGRELVQAAREQGLRPALPRSR